ncbi:hypothetical protein [Burkholderia lata]|uniref:hypothetical protein n=1 Tax=Burkholderia lata (strain ATCC 17760 / DSM 23089 / LMG 22485 / NCIMB 9086 / R18194 / 383) TaxID=482957 RepID=UPI0015818CCB|nr:hypothetical protein [Burkholderia lata]
MERKLASHQVSSSTDFDIRKIRPESLTASVEEVRKRCDQGDFTPHDPLEPVTFLPIVMH